MRTLVSEVNLWAFVALIWTDFKIWMIDSAWLAQIVHAWLDFAWLERLDSTIWTDFRDTFEPNWLDLWDDMLDLRADFEMRTWLEIDSDTWVARELTAWLSAA